MGIVREDHGPSVVDVDVEDSVVLDGDETVLLVVTAVVSVVPGWLVDVVEGRPEVVVGPELAPEPGVVAKGAAT